MREPVSAAISAVAFLAWMAGIVLAPGWWKLAAALFPFYPWYLVVERLMQVLGMV